MAEWSIAAVLKTVEPRGSRGSNPCLSAEPTGQNRTVRGQKPTNQRFVGFFIAYKSCFQDNKRTVKDIVSLLNRYLFPDRTKTVTICPEMTTGSPNLSTIYLSHI